ncbi:hypothetical protein QCA50_013296 [Cerrena zonata]|uniref:Tail specific protease domain-containing protein n=1 Tax=Cerrena zonata TaxID=2478898 RepID=A0AAW0G0M9_9APHY
MAFVKHTAGVVLTTLALSATTSAAPSAVDSCAKFAGQQYAAPSDALACLKSFPFNETLRQNVLTNVARVFDFFTFEEYYTSSPAPFQESTTNIRENLARINSTNYATDYDFNKDLYDFTNQLNDGHTRWFPDCYTTFQNLLPAPITTLEEDGVQSIFVAPDSAEFVSLLGTSYTSYFDGIGFDFKRLAGAKVLSIEGQDPYVYADYIAKTASGNYLDHGIRVNSVFSSYRISGGDFSQRFGDLAGPSFPDKDSLTMSLLLVNSTTPETVKVPYLASYVGADFTDQASFWQANCVANSNTNGKDQKTVSGKRVPKRPKASIIDKVANGVALPSPFHPRLPQIDGSSGVIKSYILPDNTTGVIFVGSFSPAVSAYYDFQTDVATAVNQFKAAGVTRLLVDLTNNGGGYVCLGQFLHKYLSGSTVGYPGFVTTNRANPLAQKIVAADIKLGVSSEISFYAPASWAFLNDTVQSVDYNYNNPSLPFTVNGVEDPTSQRFHETCSNDFVVDIPEQPPFDLSNVAIVGNGNCASTCALFSTLMFERHQTKIAIFGGKPGEKIEFKGMAGNQVLEWADLDSEIKTAEVKNDVLAPPDLLVSGNMRVNWRTAWSYLDENVPIAYLSGQPQFQFAYTRDTYNDPQNLWTFAASKLFA